MIPAEPPPDEAKVRTADLAAADVAHPYSGLSHSGRRTPTIPTRPRWVHSQQAVFGETSPLYQELVLEGTERSSCSWPRPKRSAIPAFFRSLSRRGNRRICRSCGTRIAAALAEAAKTPIDSARLDAIKSHLRYAFAGSLSTADAVANGGRRGHRGHRPPRVDQRAIRRLRPSHPRRPQRVAALYFQPGNETAIILETEIKK